MRNGTLTERFWAKVNKDSPDGCWEWQSVINRKGYGQFWHNGKSRSAHRVSWEITYGPIPDGMCVLHKCDNRKCVRPDHLFIGTCRDNKYDEMAKGRCRAGRRKLTVSQIEEIRRLYDGKLWSQSRINLAKQFNVDTSYITDIINCKTRVYPLGYNPDDYKDYKKGISND